MFTCAHTHTLLQVNMSITIIQKLFFMSKCTENFSCYFSYLSASIITNVVQKCLSSPEKEQEDVVDQKDTFQDIVSHLLVGPGKDVKSQHHCYHQRGDKLHIKDCEWTYWQMFSLAISNAVDVWSLCDGNF